MLKKKISIGALMVGALTLGACGGSSGGGEETTVIEGALSVSGSQMQAKGAPFRDLTSATYSVRCVTLSGTPSAGEGDVNPTTGEFSLELASATNVPIGCFVLSGTTILATVAFESAQEGLDGGSSTREGSFVAKDGTSKLEFGTVSLDLATGMATVNTSNIVETGGSGYSGSWVDPSGDWNMKMFCDKDLFDSTAEYNQCVEMLSQEDSSGSIHLHQYTATKTADGSKKYGLAIWESATARTNCGGEGATLPGGYTTADSFLTTAPTTGALPAPTAVSAEGGNSVCGFTATTGQTCADVTNVANWGNGTVNPFSDADCQAMCVANRIWEYESAASCVARVEVDWSAQQNATSAGDLAYDGTNYGSNFIKKLDKLDQRYVFGELFIKGNSGVVTQMESNTDHVGYHDGTNWVNIQCKVVREETVSIVQESASRAIVEVRSVERLAPSSNTNCLNSQSHLYQWLGSDGENKQKFFVKVSK